MSVEINSENHDKNNDEDVDDDEYNNAGDTSYGIIKSKGWLAIATLKPTFTFLGRDFAIFKTFTWQNRYQKSESWF